MVINLVKSILGPELYRIYKHDGLPGKTYQMNNTEQLSNTFISLVNHIKLILLHKIHLFY